METKKLYDIDGYATEFKGTVISCETIENGYAVILDQTLFFPEEGGQSPDKGVINGVNVVDVQIKNEVITHTLEEAIQVGEIIEGKIDWQHRFNNMQQHSGEHIFSGLVHDKYGFDNVGFHLSNQIVTMDFNGVLTRAQVEEIETRVNEVIVKNIPIEITFPTKEELKELEYRSKIEIAGQVRIVTIPDVDICACCAPHVHRTGEIGQLKVMNLQNYKGGVRISILCGYRALEAFCQKVEILTKLSNELSMNPESLHETVVKMKSQIQELKYEMQKASSEKLQEKIAAITVDKKNVLLFEENLDTTVMRNAVNQLVEEHEGINGIFNGNDEEGYQFIIGSKKIDCREIAKELREKLGAKGGGSDKMIQGSVQSTKNEVKQVLDKK